jgi:AraC-like DNA-binding protein
MNDRFRVSRLLPQRLADRGIAVEKLLPRAGLPAGFFQQEKIFVSTAEHFALWRSVGEMTADPAIGLKMGAEPRLERYDATAIAAVCSRSFRDALHRLARYKRLTCPEEIRVQATGEEAAVEFVFTEAEEAEPEVLVDMCLSWILSIGRRGTDGQIKPLRLELNRPNRHREVLDAHFGCRVRFSAGRNALVFRGSDLDRPFLTHNADLLALIGTQLETELREQNARPEIGEQVKQALRGSMAGKRPTLQYVAQELRMSVRTLQRRLTDAGISFQQLVEDTRRELARHYLRQSSVELNEAAYLLGYEDSNSFFRAFHLWEGTSPGEWRALNRAAGASALAG